MKTVKITCKEIKRGLENHSIKQEMINMLPYNSKEVIRYTKEIAVFKSFFNKHKLNLVANYPAKLSSYNMYYEIVNKKGKVIYTSDLFKIGTYDSVEFLKIALKELEKIENKGDTTYEICS